MYLYPVFQILAKSMNWLGRRTCRPWQSEAQNGVAWITQGEIYVYTPAYYVLISFSCWI